MVDIQSIERYLNANCDLGTGFKLDESKLDPNLFGYMSMALVKSLGLSFDCTPDELNKAMDKEASRMTVGYQSDFVPLLSASLKLNGMFDATSKTDDNGQLTNTCTPQLLHDIDDFCQKYGYALFSKTHDKSSLFSSFQTPGAIASGKMYDQNIATEEQSINEKMQDDSEFIDFHVTHPFLSGKGYERFDDLVEYFVADYQFNINKPVTGKFSDEDFQGDYICKTWGTRTSSVESFIGWMLYLKGYTDVTSIDDSSIGDLKEYVANNNVDFNFSDSAPIQPLFESLAEHNNTKTSGYDYKNFLFRFMRQALNDASGSLNYDDPHSFSFAKGDLELNVAFEATFDKTDSNDVDIMPYESVVGSRGKFSIDNDGVHLEDKFSNVDSKLDLSSTKDNLFEMSNKLDIQQGDCTFEFFCDSSFGEHLTLADLSADAGVKFTYVVKKAMGKELAKPLKLILEIKATLKDLHNFVDPQSTAFLDNYASEVPAAFISAFNTMTSGYAVSAHHITTGSYQLNGATYKTQFKQIDLRGVQDALKGFATDVNSDVHQVVDSFNHLFGNMSDKQKEEIAFVGLLVDAVIFKFLLPVLAG